MAVRVPRLVLFVGVSFVNKVGVNNVAEAALFRSMGDQMVVLKSVERWPSISELCCKRREADNLRTAWLFRVLASSVCPRALCWVDW